MRTWQAVAGAVVIGVALAGTAVALPTTDEVLAKMKAKWAGMKSFEMETKTMMGVGNDAVPWMALHIAVERWKKEGKIAERSAVTGKMGKISGDEEVKNYESRVVNDGTYIWREERDPNGERVHVTKRDSGQEPVKSFEIVPGMLERDAKEYDMKVVGEETIDGQKMYVLEGDWDPAQHNGNGVSEKRKFWIGEDDLFIRRSERTYDSGKGKQVTTSEYSNVKVDQKIDPAVFEYAPPEGVEVKDLTGKK